MSLFANMSSCVFNHMCDQHRCLNIGHVSDLMLGHKYVKGAVAHTSGLRGSSLGMAGLVTQLWKWENEREETWVKKWGFEHTVLSAFLRVSLPTSKARKLLGPAASSLHWAFTSHSLAVVTFCPNTVKEHRLF